MQWVRVRVRVRVRVSVSFAFSEAFCRNSGCRNSGLYPNVPNSMRPGFAQAYQHCFFFRADNTKLHGFGDSNDALFQEFPGAIL